MASRISTAVKELLQSIDVTAGPRPAVEWLSDICFVQDWASTKEDAREWAERTEARFIERIRREVNSLTGLGRFVSVAFNSSSEYMIQGCAFEEPIDAEDVKEAKKRRARVSTYAGALRALDPLDFEALCAGVLALIGVERASLTPRSGDEGIDFYGRLRLEGVISPQDVFPTIQRQLAVWMIGQAKRYRAMQVSTPDIRELVGSIDLARSGAYSGGQKYEDLDVRVCDPVFYLFFTTGQLSADSWRLLDRSGVVGMDGHMLASFLADREVGIEAGEFDSIAFQNWIEKHRD